MYFFSALLLTFAWSSLSQANCSPAGPLSEISCIKCGLKEATGQDASEKWIALLAAMAQDFPRYEGEKEPKPTSIIKQGPKNLQKDVISMIQAYGFCSSYPRKGKEVGYGDLTAHGKMSTARMSEKVRRFYMGIGNESFQNISKNDSTRQKRDQKEFLEYMGIADPPLSSNRRNLKFLFDDGKNWYEKSVAERQKNFTKALNEVFSTENPKDIFESKYESGKGFRECLEQIEFLQNTANNGWNFSKSSSLVATKVKNERLCRQLATSCSIDDTSFCNVEGLPKPQKEVAEAPKETQTPAKPEGPKADDGFFGPGSGVR